MVELVVKTTVIPFIFTLLYTVLFTSGHIECDTDKAAMENYLKKKIQGHKLVPKQRQYLMNYLNVQLQGMIVS